MERLTFAKHWRSWADTRQEWQRQEAVKNKKRAEFSAYAEKHGFENLCRGMFNVSEFVFVDSSADISVWQSIVPNVQSDRLNELFCLSDGTRNYPSSPKSEQSMTTATQPQVFEEIAEFMARFPVREEVLAFRPSVETQARASELLWKSNSGTLTDEEQDELADLGRAELFVRMLKARM